MKFVRGPSLFWTSNHFSFQELIIWYMSYERASLMAQLVKNPLTMQETPFNSWVRKIPWRRDRIPTPVFLGFPGGSAGKESTCNVGDLGSISGLGRSPAGGHGNWLQDSCLGNPHGQRSQMGCSLWGSQRVGQDWATKHTHALWRLLFCLLPLPKRS